MQSDYEDFAAAAIGGAVVSGLLLIVPAWWLWARAGWQYGVGWAGFWLGLMVMAGYLAQNLWEEEADVACPSCGEWAPARSPNAPYDSLVCRRIHEDTLDWLDEMGIGFGE